MQAKWTRLYARLSGAVFVKLLLALLGFWAGEQVDEWVGTKPIFAVVFLSMGLAIGIWWIIKIAEREAGRE